MFVFTSWLVSHEVCIHIKYFGYLHFPAPALWSPVCIYLPWTPICVYRPCPPICIYRPWPQICIYRSWSPICIYQPWPEIFIYRPWSVRNLDLHIPTMSSQFVYTDPGLRFLLLCNDFAFTFLSIVVAVTVVILAIVVTS